MEETMVGVSTGEEETGNADGGGERGRLSGAISLAIHGIHAQFVEVEVDIIKGLPNFTIVGLPDSTIKESKDRIRSALENSGYQFPPRNFVVNLAPAGFRKQGANFDLPIAVSILHSTGQVGVDPRTMPMVGELALDGRVKPVKGAISMAIALYRRGYRSLIVPWENRFEASAIDDVEIYPVRTISEALEALHGGGHPFRGGGAGQIREIDSLDFRDVKGQETAKRALEIAAAGHHNILLYGPPGAGGWPVFFGPAWFSPPLTRDEAISATMVHSAGGMLGEGEGLITRPPFRAPHHTASDAALVGGGKVPGVGEISLAHNGVLFLDEFVEFRTNVLQALRQPLESCDITISRAGGTVTFPADFMMVASCNPCQCGFYLDPEIPCSCSETRVRSYFSKIAGPILDRIDIEVMLNRVPYRDLMEKGSAEPSEAIRERVMTAREAQTRRFAGGTTVYNSRMTNQEAKTHCGLDTDSERILESAIKKMNLSARSFFRILKVSRTIADLAGSHRIEKPHLLESLSYKSLHRLYAVR